MISEAAAAPVPEAFVWVWLPGHLDPVVAGRLAPTALGLQFNYGRSYLARSDAVALYLPELPLVPGLRPLPAGLSMPGCLRDAAPDAWGRRTILHQRGLRGGVDPAVLGELTYMLASGSNRVGALDFQPSATRYVAREGADATLEQLMESAGRIEQGLPLTPALAQVIEHGTSIGGARPKATLLDDGQQWIAKFSSTTDLYPVVKAEYVAMRLAALAGLDVAPVKLAKAAGRDVLLVRRFDRSRQPDGWRRHGMVSVLTLLGLDEMMAAYASYQDLAEIVRHRFARPGRDLRELFCRLVFNILCGNTDDHARNHAAFWDGSQLSLTPAFDLCPQLRTGQEATQAMKIVGNDRFSRLSVCLAAAPSFQLSQADARAIIAAQLACLRTRWTAVCEEAQLGAADRDAMWGRQFINPFSLQGYAE
jgi:serine/threonine-protein kinase HipA